MNDEPISTGCGPVDELLGGVRAGTVTQVYGPPAAGKTNLALSAAVEAAIDGGTAVYIDTEGLSVDRFEQLLSARVDDADRPTADAASDDASGRPDPDGADPTVEAVASRIVVEDALDFEEQAEAVRDVEDFADRADLVVLDSATGFTDSSEPATVTRGVAQTCRPTGDPPPRSLANTIWRSSSRTRCSPIPTRIGRERSAEHLRALDRRHPSSRALPRRQPTGDPRETPVEAGRRVGSVPDHERGTRGR